MYLSREYETYVDACEDGIRISQIDEYDNEHVVVLSVRQFYEITSNEDTLIKAYSEYQVEQKNRGSDD